MSWIAMPHHGRFSRRATSVVRRIADSRQTLPDVGDVPIGDIVDTHLFDHLVGARQ
jgi:hypothetical protein